MLNKFNNLNKNKRAQSNTHARMCHRNVFDTTKIARQFLSIHFLIKLNEAKK